MPADPQVVEASRKTADAIATNLIPWLLGFILVAVVLGSLRGFLDRIGRRSRRQTKR